jgi:hypothetical protein
MPNNTFETALQIQNPQASQTFSSTLTTQDSRVIYQMNLVGPSTGHFSLTGLTGNVDVELYDNSPLRNRIAVSNNPGKLSEAIVLQNLAPGTYYLQVDLNPDSASANFNLNVLAKTTADLSNIFWRNAPNVRLWEMNGIKIETTTNYDSGDQNFAPEGEWQAQFFADTNGDGEDDIIWRNSRTGDFTVWIMKGNRATIGRITAIPTTFEIQAVADLDGNGRADIIWKNPTDGLFSVWLMDSTGSYYEDFNYFRFDLSQLQIQQVGDFDKDGKQDLLFRWTDGRPAIWLMDGKNYKSSAFLQTMDSSWQIQASGDVNGDGRSDIIWRNTATGNVRIWQMNGTSISKQSADLSLTVDWQFKQIGDTNGDGRADLIWQNQQTKQPLIWSFNKDTLTLNAAESGTLTLGGNTVGALPDWELVAAPDFSNDKKVDLLWRNEKAQAAAVWLMNGKTVDSYTVYTDQDGSLAQNWKVNGILKRKLRIGESSISGGTTATAFDVGVLNTGEKEAKYQDQVTTATPDFYKFTLDSQTGLKTMSVAGTNVTIDLFKAAADGSLGSKITFTPGMLLERGMYFINIKTSVAGQPSYTLTLNAVPNIVNPKPFGTPLQILLPTVTSGANFPTINLGTTTVQNREVKVRYSLTNTEKGIATGFKVRFNLLNISTSTADVLTYKQRLDVVKVETAGTALFGTGTESGTGRDLEVTGIVSQNQKFDGIVTLRLPPATNAFWSVLPEKVYLLEMLVDPTNELVERQDNLVKGEEDNLLTPTTGNEGPFSINVTNYSLPNLRTKSITSSFSNISLSSTNSQAITLNYEVENNGQRGTPGDARIPMRFFLSSDNGFSFDDLELFQPDGSYVPDLDPIAAGASSGSKQVTLDIPSFRSSSFWQQFGGQNRDFYIVMMVNDPGDSEIFESDPFDNYNRSFQLGPTSTGIDAGRIKISVPTS